MAVMLAHVHAYLCCAYARVGLAGRGARVAIFHHTNPYDATLCAPFGCTSHFVGGFVFDAAARPTALRSQSLDTELLAIGQDPAASR